MNPLQRRRSLLKIAALLGFIAGAVYFFHFTDTGRAITAESVRDYFQQLDPWAARFAYVVCYIVGTVLLVPGVILSFAGAVLFGAWEGTLYTWIGATIGATLCYYLARLLGRDFVEGLLGGRFQALDQRLRDNGFTGLLILRLVPLFPFNGINFASGLTSIRPRDYIMATAIGILPGTFVYQFLFARLGGQILERGISLHDFLELEIVIALGLFVAFIIAGKLASKRLTRSGPAKPPTS